MSQLAFHQDKASENSPNDDPDNQAGNGNKGDGHGDTPPIRNSTIMLMATLRTVATKNSYTRMIWEGTSLKPAIAMGDFMAQDDIERPPVFH